MKATLISATQMTTRCGHLEAAGRFTLADAPGWIVTVTLHSNGEVLTVSGLRIDPSEQCCEDGASLNGALVRGIPVGRLSRMLRDAAKVVQVDDDETAREAELRTGLPRPAWWSEGDEPIGGSTWGAEIAGEGRTGRKGLPDAELARFARDYVALLSKSAPRQVLAQQANLSVAGVAKRLGQCRERGLLRRTAGAGRAGDELTDKAIEILGDEPHPEG